jgi:hypothetical protein
VQGIGIKLCQAFELVTKFFARQVRLKRQLTLSRQPRQSRADQCCSGGQQHQGYK